MFDSRFLIEKSRTGRSRFACAFSLIEIMVVIGLLSVIVLGLMAMFSQTQNAFKLGMAQTDVLESGRMGTDLLVRELEQMSPTYARATNFQVDLAQVAEQRLPGNSGVRTNKMQDVFFV